MARPDGLPHFFQHFDKTINGIGRLAGRRTQFPNRMKCPVCVGVSVNNQQPVHGLAGGIRTFSTVSVILPPFSGCVGIAFCANGRSSSECTRLPAGSTMVAVTKIIRFFLIVYLLWLWKRRPTIGRSPMTGTLSFWFCMEEET